MRGQLREPDHVAAGMRAVTESLKFTFRESGFARGLRDWFKISQKDGFACQSCACPARMLIRMRLNSARTASKQANILVSIDSAADRSNTLREQECRN